MEESDFDLRWKVNAGNDLKNLMAVRVACDVHLFGPLLPFLDASGCLRLLQIPSA
jgi:hypothetical protein